MLSVDGASLHYSATGSGPETIVFAHGLFWSGEMFAPQIAALSGRYRCIAFDFRGQGRSDVVRGGYDMDTLTRDAAKLIEDLGVSPCHFVGLSMGGFIGMRLAARRPELLRSLALLETSAGPEPAEKQGPYRLMLFAARTFGLRSVVDRLMPIMFGRTFMTDPERATERAAWRAKLLSNDRTGIIRATRGVLTRSGVEGELGAIAAPTLVIVGDEDVATPPDRARAIYAGVNGARLVTIPRAGHTSTIECPEAVTAALTDFFAGLESPGAARDVRLNGSAARSSLARD